MRKIVIENWKAKVGEQEFDESLLTVLNALISMNADEMPKGLDNFRTFQRLSNSFSKAETSGILELEESEYLLLTRIIDKGLPAVWAMNKKISKAIESFLNVKQE